MIKAFAGQSRQGLFFCTEGLPGGDMNETAFSSGSGRGMRFNLLAYGFHGGVKAQ